MDLLTPKIFAFVLIMCRLGAFLAVAPIFSWTSIPVRVKTALTVLVAVFFAAILPIPPLPSTTSFMAVILLMVTEIIYGLALGYVCMILFATVKLSARIAERQMGLTMSSVLNPITGENSQTLSILIEIMFILLFLSAEGHHILLMTISRSYDSLPLGTIPRVQDLTDSIIISSSTMLTLGLKMAAPILAAFLLMMVVLAIMARVAPEANILFLSLPLRVGLGLIMVGIFIPFIGTFIDEFTKYIDKLIPL